MGNGASASPVNALGELANKIAVGDYEGKSSESPAASSAGAAAAAAASATDSAEGAAGATQSTPSSSSGSTVEEDETMKKVHKVRGLVIKLQNVRQDIAAQSKLMSDSKILERMVTDEAEVEKREVGTVHVSRDRSKSMEEYSDGTTIRRIDGSIERVRADGSVEQISSTNEVTVRFPNGDVAVLAEHDTLLNQKLADSTQIQTNLETRVQIIVFPDGKRIETDAKTKTTVTLWPDGKQVTVFDDKTTLTLYPDGRSHQVSPNGTVVTIAVDGTKEQKNPDGSSIVVYPDGRKVRTLANGNVIESYPDGVSRQLDTSNPEFGARSAVPAENRGGGGSSDGASEGKHSESAKSLDRAGTQVAEGLPSLNGSPGVTREPTETGFSPSSGRKKKKKSPNRSSSARSSEDEEDEDDSDFGSPGNVKVAMSIANLASAMSGSKTSANANATLQLIDLDAVQVIRLLREWGCDSFRKDFATKAVTGKMLYDIDSVSHELLQGAPSSVRKDFYARLQQAKKNGLSRTTATNVAESPTSKLRRAITTKLSFGSNALDKSKLMWGNDFDPENIRNWVSKGAFIDWHNTEERGCTIVHMVAKAGKLDSLKVLVELKADLNAMNNRKTTPLHLACRKGHMEIVKLLLESGADPRIKNKKGTALDEARAESKSAKIANLRANIISVFGHLDK